jgi:polyisoprenoid-binding protein YceI
VKLRLFVLTLTITLIAAGCTGASTSTIPVETEQPVEQVETIVVASPTSEPAELQPTEAGISVETEVAAGVQVTDAVVPQADVQFRIVPEETEARFLVEEILLGAPKVVVGATSAVEGEILANTGNPSAAQVDVRVDVRTLVTDNGNRNSAIQRMILETGAPENQTAQFTATSVSEMPETITIGEPFSFKITGNFSAHGVTKELTFDVTVTAVSEDRLEGSATTTVNFTEFATIPRLPPQVASVAEPLTLQIDFVAVAE